MAPFRSCPVKWTGSIVHSVTDSVWQRSSKFTDCGEKIGADPVYDGEGGHATWCPLVVNCPRCLEKKGG
jgi:hypothetical protein